MADEEPKNLASKFAGTVERWLHQQVGPIHDALTADPLRAVTVDQMKVRLAAEHERAMSKANSSWPQPD